MINDQGSDFLARNERSRYWTFVGYPDSLHPNWIAYLTECLNLTFAVSPLHDADLNGDGEQKKPHYHILLKFDSLKSFEQIKEITDVLEQPIPQLCRNPRGMVRYMIHLDNPDKAQYKMDDIRLFGGFSLDDYFNRSVSENRLVLREIVNFCRDNDISDFCQIVDVAFDLGNDDWIDCLTRTNSVFFAHYLKSKFFRDKDIKR